MSRTILIYNPFQKISKDIINRFLVAEKFFQNQTLQKTYIKRFSILNNHLYLSIVYKKNEKNKIFNKPDSNIAAFIDGSPIIGNRIISAKDLVNEYIKVGIKNLGKKINGTWSAVIIDKKDSSIIILRDKFGRVPFYYSKKQEYFLAGSSSGSLIKTGLTSATYNENMVARYASSNYMATFGSKNSFFKGISLLSPASFLKIDIKTKIKEERYWSPDVKEKYFKYSDNTIKKKFLDRFYSIIKKYYEINKDNNFGVTLSGGMDSGAILGLLHKESKKRIKAISMTYREDTSFDETDLIKCSVRDHVSNWTDIKIDEEQLLEDFPTMYSRFDVPMCTVTAYCHEILFKNAVERGLPFLFSGAGGDALQAGTYPFYLYNLADLKLTDQKKYEYELNCWIKNHGTTIYPKNKNTAETFFTNRINFKEKGKFKSSSMLLVDRILNSEFAKKSGDLGQILVNFSGDYMRSYIMQELWYDSNAAFESEDVMCWSWGVNVLSPFFDQEIIDFAWRLPPEHKIKHGVNKFLARKALKGIVPDEILNTISKKGFNAPFDLWVRGSLKNFVMDHLTSDKFRSRGIYDQKIFNKCLDDHMANNANHMMLIWQALNLELWMRNWIDQN